MCAILQNVEGNKKQILPQLSPFTADHFATWFCIIVKYFLVRFQTVMYKKMCEKGLMVSTVSLSCIIYSLSLPAMRLSNHASKSLDCGCRYGNLSSGCNVGKGLIFKKKF